MSWPDRDVRLHTERAVIAAQDETKPVPEAAAAARAALIRDQDMVTSPISGDRKMLACATRDIAAVATRLLLDTSWRGAGEVPVLGPEELSFDDMAWIMSEVLEGPIRFQQEPGVAFKDRMIRFGTSEAMAQGLLDMALAKDAGLDNGVRRTPENSTPTTFRQWCQDTLKSAVLA